MDQRSKPPGATVPIPRRSFLGFAATGMLVPHQLARAEPITAAAAAAWAGAKLLEGALQYAGGQF